MIRAPIMPGGDAPGAGPRELLGVVPSGKTDVLRFGEVLAQEVGGARLDGLPVLHHGFYSVGLFRSGKAFRFRFFSRDGGDGEHVALEFLIHLVHGEGFFNGFLPRFMGGVAFLPQKFRSTQEDAGPHFPAHDVAPLVDFEGEVAVAGRPAREGCADNGFRRGADDEGFRELPGRDHVCFSGGFILLGFQPVVGNYGAFRCKAFSMLGFLFQVGDGDEQGEVGIGVAGVLEALVQVLLDEFPDGVAPRLDDHAAAHFGVFRHVGSLDDLLVPLGEVLGAGGGDCGLLRHMDGVLKGRGEPANALKGGVFIFPVVAEGKEGHEYGDKVAVEELEADQAMAMEVMNPVMNTFLGERTNWATSWPPSRG